MLNTHQLPAEDGREETRQTLGLKLLTYVLAFSFIVTLATSAYILYSDYRHGTNELTRSIEQIQAGYQESISYSLWNFDTQQIKTQLSGILNFPGVVNVYIETSEGLLHSTGDFQQDSSNKYAFDLLFESSDRQYPLGVLSITLDYEGLYEELAQKAINIIVTQFIKTFSVSLFILFIFQRLVTRRLQIMSSWAHNFSFDNLDAILVTGNPHEQKSYDEIDQVENAINTMRVSLKEDIDKRRHAEQELKLAQHKLSIAINNAELGFCEYNQKADRMSPNEHFANHLDISSESLRTMKHPVDWFKELIVGERTIEQRERINQLIHGHMERICTELSLLTNKDEVKHFDTTIQISEWDESGLPASIIFCILDKTQEVISSRQAAELNVALEQKVTKRTEELSNEQSRSQARIKKLEQDVARYERQHRNLQTQKNLQPMLLALEKLKEFHRAEDSMDQHASGELIGHLSRHLRITTQAVTTTFNLVDLTEKKVGEFLHGKRNENKTTLRLPYSLMLDSYENIIGYVITLALEAVEQTVTAPFDAARLSTDATLKDDHVLMTIKYEDVRGHDLLDPEDTEESPQLLLLRMSHYVFEELLDGSIRVESEEKILSVTVRFSVNLYQSLIEPVANAENDD